MSVIIQKRRDTAANFAETNRIFAQGETMLEIDTGKEKEGDGITAYNALPYKSGGAAVPSSLRILKHPDNSGAGVELKDIVEVYLKVGSNEYKAELRYMNLLATGVTTNYGSEPLFTDGNFTPMRVTNLNE